MIDFVRVGLKISELRKAKNMTQDDLANNLFVTRQALSKWETGASLPTAETLLELCKIFKISFEDLLCLNDEITIDENNIFLGHDRMFIINSIINGSIDIYIPDVFYQFSPNERLLIIKAIKENKLKTNLEEFIPKLTPKEISYLTN